MRRGTTPTLKLTTDQDWTGYEVWLTIEEKKNGGIGTELTLQGSRLTVSATTVYVTLTQEETLSFNKSAQIQLKGSKDGTVIATDIVNIKVLPVLNEEVM